MSNFQIGVSIETLTALDSLTTSVPDPKATFKPHSKRQVIGNGLVKGMGWITASWIFTTLTTVQRDQLKTFCSGSSAEVYIRTTTMNNESVYQIYKAVMIWPEEENPKAGLRFNFEIIFQRLEVVS